MDSKSRIFFWLENLLFFWIGLIVILLIGGKSLSIPTWIQVIGRTHPLILHFPIVLLLLAIAIVWIPNSDWGKTGKPILVLGANLAGFTVVAGLILATEDYEGTSFSWHKWLGIATFFLSTGIYFLLKKQTQSLKIGSTVLAVVLVLTGHFGANLTHGDNFLFEPVLSKEAQLVAFGDAEVFRDLVQPIMEAKCISCHKEGKMKGELRLDKIEGIKKGGETGPFFLAGDTENSLFLQKIHLPLEDEDHMPPKNKAQLTDEEIEILRLWVASGGSFDQKVADLNQDEPLFQLASNRFTSEKTYSFSPASEDDIEELNNFFRKVKPIYPGSPALEAAYFGASTFDPNSLSELKSVKKQIVRLNLNRMPLQEVDLGFLQDFTHLEELQLNFTGISSSQLKSIENINSLQSLAISGNSLGSESLESLKKLSSLRKLFFWESNLTEDEQKSLQDALPNTKIDFGFDGKGIILQLNPPKIETEKIMFDDSVEVILSHPIQSVQIRYSLDESEPDSISSLIYSKPVFIKGTSTIRAKAFANDWIRSEETKTTVFRKGIQPKSFMLAIEPNPKYKGIGAETLFDGVKGKANHTSGEWLGFTDSALEVEISLKEGQHPKSIQASLLLNEGAYIFPPESAELWVAENSKWKKIEVPKPKESLKAEGARYGFLNFLLPEEDFDQIKIKLKPISKLPKWHPGAGAKGWVFVDELFIY
ncbi:putative membrane protein [Algoriphagus boseongensis]|uniref:Putative membrane protein n=1 Tax=Algoriphagus boseongensis TaxID=1442587 RepID=A0A4R6T9V1_9BACT|nr:c-type cytochrome domain-containing protein [Algoriphagus boseongensis]TDQ18682.1 putative membrane protein [Algoriphagus boseongensis]